MTKRVTLFLVAFCYCIYSFSVTQTVGTSGDYSTLKAAFDDINVGNLIGSITLEIISSTTETATASLNASGTGSANYTDVTIYPTGSGYVISGSLDAPLIQLNGADNVIIDGRVNVTGSTKDLEFSNTNTGTSASTIQFIESSENNTVKYSVLKGMSTGTATGVVFFSTASAGNGNDNNTITNCDIRDGATTPQIGIYSAGTGSRENSGITISYNNIFNCYLNNSGYGVNVFSNSTNFTISDNSFYHTSARSGDNNLVGIYVISGNEHVIHNNYIGGSSVNCAGSSMTYNYTTFSFDNRIGVIGIYLNVGTTSASSVQNNTVTNITVNNTSPDNRQADTFCGILVVDGDVNIGTVVGNVIGSGTGTGSVSLNRSSGEYAVSEIFGIAVAGSGAINISNNQIGSISMDNPGSESFFFKAIDCATYNGISANATVDNNQIGSLTTANSIQSSSNVPGASIWGIAGCPVVTNNTISNIANNTPNSYFASVEVIGISNTYGTSSALSGNFTITGNLIKNLSCSASSTGSENLAALIGISFWGTTSGQTISGNTIDSLANDHPTAAVKATGIFYRGPTGGTNVISKNHIRNILLSSSSTGATVKGIDIKSGTSTYSNNIISLGYGLTEGYVINGIYENGAASNNSTLYHNTVYIEGSPGGGSNTAALYSNANTNIRNIRNNIFYNARSNTAGTQKHYAAYFNYLTNTNLTLNYNNYYAPGTGGVLGFYNSSDQASLPLVTGNDANSVITDPVLLNAGGDEPEDFYPLNPQTGASGTGISDDFLEELRGEPFMGALEANVWKGATSTDFNTASNWIPATVPDSGKSIVFHSNPDNHCLLDQDRYLGTIANRQAVDQLWLNGHKLVLHGGFNFSNDAKVKANSISSTLELAGEEEQVISGDYFVDNQINNLTINNANNAIAQDTIKILGTLTKTNGSVDATIDSAHIYFASSMATQNILDNFFVNNELYDLTIDNEDNVLLTSNIMVSNNLNFMEGQLITNEDTLIMNDGAQIFGAGSSSYINGICKKMGNEAFTFEIGDSSYYAPIGISAPSMATDEFTAKYIYTDPEPFYNDDSLESGLHHISNYEYWILDRTNGSSDVSVTLSWDLRSGPLDNVDDLLVARWDGSEWANEGNAGTTGDTTSGTVTSNVVSSFSPFTLGSSTINNPLPIQLLSFDAKKEGDDCVKLEWQTLGEVNNDYFVVERSVDGVSFEQLFEQPGMGNISDYVSYSKIDSFPHQGVSYYRLKQVDLNGDYTYSQIRSVSFEGISIVAAYPNPAIDNVVLLLNSSFPTTAIIQIFDPLGKEMLRKQQKIGNELTTLDINIAALPTSSYIIKVTTEDNGRFFTQKQILKIPRAER